MSHDDAIGIAAAKLIEALGGYEGIVGISSYRDASGVQCLRVFISPNSKHRKQFIPPVWMGFPVVCEIADPPSMNSPAMAGLSIPTVRIQQRPWL